LIPGRLYYEFGDNEGLLSTIPALATTLLGVLTGVMIKTSKSQIYKILWMLIFGSAFVIAGIIWSYVFPLNKILWTSSYALLSGGCSLLLLCLFYWLIDYKGYKKWAFPFIVIGMNAITIYAVQGLFDFGILANIIVHGFIGYMGQVKDIFFIICIILLKWFFLYFLYKKKVFLKI
jgi:predicted acyltransferase